MERINGQDVYNFYNRKNKWLGIIDYKSLLFFIVYIFCIFKIVLLLSIDNIYKMYIIVNLIIPVVIFILFNIKEESIVDKLYVIILFFLKRKQYVKMNYYAKLNIKYVKNVEK